MKFIFGVFLICLFSCLIFAQTPQKIEQELIKLYAKVSDNSSYKSNTDIELLEKANDDFKAKLLTSTKIASSLKHSFKDLDKEISITTSEDGKFRAFSWDTLNGGTMHFFETVYQFQGKDGKVYSQTVQTQEGDAGGFVHDIFTVQTKLGNVYMVCNTAIGSTQDRFESVKLFRIEKNKLNDSVKIIKTKSGLTDSISFGYNFFSVVERKERPVELILFDKKTNILKLPIVTESKKFPNGEVTNKFISYKFNGTNFVKVN